MAHNHQVIASFVPLHREGYLYKHSRRGIMWNLRWVEVHGGSLCYWNRRPIDREPPKRVISLHDASVESVLGSKKLKRRFAFDVRVQAPGDAGRASWKEELLEFALAQEDHCNLWVRTIQNNITSSEPVASFPPTPPPHAVEQQDINTPSISDTVPISEEEYHTIASEEEVLRLIESIDQAQDANTAQLTKDQVRAILNELATEVAKHRMRECEPVEEKRPDIQDHSADEEFVSPDTGVLVAEPFAAPHVDTSDSESVSVQRSPMDAVGQPVLQSIPSLAHSKPDPSNQRAEEPAPMSKEMTDKERQEYISHLKVAWKTPTKSQMLRRQQELHQATQIAKAMQFDEDPEFEADLARIQMGVKERTARAMAAGRWKSEFEEATMMEKKREEHEKIMAKYTAQKQQIETTSKKRHVWEEAIGKRAEEGNCFGSENPQKVEDVCVELIEPGSLLPDVPVPLDPDTLRMQMRDDILAKLIDEAKSVEKQAKEYEKGATPVGTGPEFNAFRFWRHEYSNSEELEPL